jgi:hypothetical protein
MAFRQQLYSILPELQDLDKNIGPIISHSNLAHIKNQYDAYNSNCETFDNLLSINPGIVFNYISVLENQVVLGKEINNISNVAPYISQKIAILESAVSNLVQSSTQSSQ